MVKQDDQAGQCTGVRVCNARGCRRAKTAAPACNTRRCRPAARAGGAQPRACAARARRRRRLSLRGRHGGRRGLRAGLRGDPLLPGVVRGRRDLPRPPPPIPPGPPQTPPIPAGLPGSLPGPHSHPLWASPTPPGLPIPTGATSPLPRAPRCHPRDLQTPAQGSQTPSGLLRHPPPPPTRFFLTPSGSPSS